ncbi:hypothetical protein EBZ38_08300 [bacterium]|nr:hypothetical protein [Betaproteobacteria bacterium]NDC95342.1 hypothetical protein [bacterium]NDD84256.1 hypothetical protein [bacterium]
MTLLVQHYILIVVSVGHAQQSLFLCNRYRVRVTEPHRPQQRVEHHTEPSALKRTGLVTCGCTVKEIQLVARIYYGLGTIGIDDMETTPRKVTEGDNRGWASIALVKMPVCLIGIIDRYGCPMETGRQVVFGKLQGKLPQMRSLPSVTANVRNIGPPACHPQIQGASRAGNNTMRNNSNRMVD